MRKSIIEFFTKRKSKILIRQCHTGTVGVFKDPKSGIQIYAGGVLRNVKISPTVTVLDCGTLDKYFHKEFKIKVDNLIQLKWPNGNIPPYDHITWEDIMKELQGRGGDVLVTCLGGHGRTGTALSILSYLMCNNRSPIKSIRKKYCQNAVETTAQVRYINKICGLNLNPEDYIEEHLYSDHNIHWYA